MCMKKLKNELHYKNILDSTRIRSILGDVRKCLKKYRPYINDKVKRKECFDLLIAIIPHHCGHHYLCFDCNFRIIQQENSTESDATHKDLYAQSPRYGETHDFY